MKYEIISNAEKMNEAKKIREKVFIDEQNVSHKIEFDEFDKFDNNSIDVMHILVIYKNHAVGTGRLRVINQKGKLERICVLKEYRNLEIGNFIIKTLEKQAEIKGISDIYIEAQIQAKSFYSNLKYIETSEIFNKGHIKHVTMVKSLK